MYDEFSYCSYVVCQCIIPRQIKDWDCNRDCEHHPDFIDDSNFDDRYLIYMEVSDVNS